MPRYLPEPPFNHGTRSRIGILLVNLGTPEAPQPGALRRYLREFLSDPRVVEIPRWLWWPILHGLILTTRPRQSARKYAAIWTPAGSPLRVHTQRQAEALEQRLGIQSPDSPPRVVYAMRYGQPSIAAGLAELKGAGCDRLLLLPLYPQYAASTTGSSQDALFTALARSRNVPALRVVRDYHDHPAYITALKDRIEGFWANRERPEVLVMSFHGVPRFSLDKGDPYHCECLKTGRLLAEALGLEEQQYRIAFQSLFGRAEWVKPYTAPLVESLAKQGVKSIDVVCPGFPADCLETLEEIGIEVKATFLTHGGREYRYIPALNDHPVWLDALATIAREHLEGWSNAREDSAALERQRQRAIARGAVK